MKITALLDALNNALAEPFALAWVSNSPRFLLVFTVIYAVAVIVAVTDQKNTRPGAEYGSAAWGDVFRLNKFYMDRHGSNLLLTQHFHIGIDGYKHKHNTNILIVGGSGAGKTRTYGVPNVLECACSMVITDPKSEILRKTGNLLKQKGYEVLVFDLINPAASFCYNPFVYVHDDREVLTLIENLIQNTTPSHSKSSDPFWEKSETALLQALMLYLLHEAPPEEQNFSILEPGTSSDGSDSGADSDTPDSKLVTKFIPAYKDNYTKSRKAQGGTISEITIHHCASILTIEALGALWQREGRKGSSHYGVSETNIGQYVHERDVAWTNGNWEANCRAVTIETSNSGGAPEWPVSDTTFQTLVTLVADIARRNDLGKLVKGKNLTWHSMYAATACPGPYLSGKLQELVDKANTINGF